MRAQTPKGFRDFLPPDALKRRFVMKKIVEVFERFGFDPLETPTLEYEETLAGKYGEEEKLIYKFETPGKDKVALRYDQTVPLARVIAQYGPNGKQVLPIPFKRYQIQSAYRGENTQKGRYREFLQCDADIIGSASLYADAEILALAYEIYKGSPGEPLTSPNGELKNSGLGLDIVIKINDRKLLEGIENKYLSAIDKLNKIGKDGVLEELQMKGLSRTKADELVIKFENLKPSNDLEKIVSIYKQMGYPDDSLVYDSTLVRGLDYYTGLIMEVVLKDDPNGSAILGGGRYDQLIGKFSGVDLPAIGFALGFDRTIEAMEQAGILNENPTNSKVLVTIFSPELVEKSLEISSLILSNNINCELWLDPDTKLDRQLKYADQKGIPFAVIIGPEEAKSNLLTLKDLKKKFQETISLDELISRLS